MMNLLFKTHFENMNQASNVSDKLPFRNSRRKKESKKLINDKEYKFDEIALRYLYLN